MTTAQDEVALLSTGAQDTDDTDDLFGAGQSGPWTKPAYNGLPWEGIKCCRSCACLSQIFKKIFPHGYWSECKELLKVTWPIVLTQLAYYSIILVSLIFCGHLGKESLDGVAVAATLINIVGYCVMVGLASACDTLFSQTYGSENKYQVGIIMQRAIQILLLACLPCIGVLLNAEHLMLAMGQQPEVARLGGRYSSVFILALPAAAFNNVLMKYLQAQSIVAPSLLIALVVNFFNAGFHALFLYGLKMDVTGAALSVCLSNWSIVFLHIGYIYCSGVYKTTWKGLTKESLCDWKSFMVLALPGLVMITLEWSSFEVLVFVVGIQSVPGLAAYTIVYSVASLAFMFTYIKTGSGGKTGILTLFWTVPLGISTAAGVRVGNHLGAHKPGMALTSSRVSITLAWMAGLINGVILLSTKNVLPKVYTNDSEVTSIASALIPQLALFSLFDFTQGTLSGVIRGAGHQKFGAITNLVAYYVIALPVAIPLTLKTSLKVAGAWWGMTLSTFFQSVVFMIKVWALNWPREAEKAQIRAGVQKTIEVDISAENDEENEESAKETSTDLHTGQEKHSSENGSRSDIKDSEDIVPAETPSGDLVTTPSPKRNYSSVYVSRLAILLFLIIILIAGVIARMFLDSRVHTGKNPDCFLVNATELNQTKIQDGLFTNHSDLISNNNFQFLNATYTYEVENFWNTSFFYCRGVIQSILDEVNWKPLSADKADLIY